MKRAFKGVSWTIISEQAIQLLFQTAASWWWNALKPCNAHFYLLSF